MTETRLPEEHHQPVLYKVKRETLHCSPSGAGLSGPYRLGMLLTDLSETPLKQKRIQTI